MFADLFITLANTEITLTMLISGVLIVFLVFAGILTAWRLFDKADVRPVYSLIPIYNLYYWSLITTGSPTAFILMCVVALLFVVGESISLVMYGAIAGFIMLNFWVAFKTAKVFDKGIIFGIFIAICPYLALMLIALTKSKYIDPSIDYYDDILQYVGETHEDVNDHIITNDEQFKPVEEDMLDSYTDLKRVEEKKQMVQNNENMSLTELVKRHAEGNKQE